MSFKVKDIVGNVFYTERKQQEEEKKKAKALSDTVNNVFGETQKDTKSSYNPFLKQNGELVNPLLNYQTILDNPNVSQVAKNYITQATGLSPTPTEETEESGTITTPIIDTPIIKNKQEITQPEESQQEKTQTKDETQTSSFAESVGKRVANTAKYSNSAATGQCVWYVRGRATEKLGKDTGAIGNANEMWYNAKSDAKVSAKSENIKPNMIVSYKYGTSNAGKTYGHVIYIEDVVGDTVYYTEGGSGYYKSGKDGVVKTATRQGILEGVNTSGGRMGSNVIGFIDLSKY